LSAAAYEERIAPLLDTLGRELEAAVHRISAASCYQKAEPVLNNLHCVTSNFGQKPSFWEKLGFYVFT
jgi:hypothetical protein